MNKLCNGCDTIKPADEFRKDRRNKSGLGSRCLECCRSYDRSEKAKAALRTYRKTPEGKLASKRFRQSDNGRLARLRCHYRRRDRQCNLNTYLSSEDIKYIRLRFDNQCFKCGDKDDLTIDHHRPLGRGYGLSVNNAVLLCRSCNSSKGIRMPWDFYAPEELEYLSSLSLV